MIDAWEKTMLEKLGEKKFLLLDALERALEDCNDCGLEKDCFGYAWIQLGRARKYLDKINTYVQAIRVRRMQREAS
jgi:hypothetical protein